MRPLGFSLELSMDVVEARVLVVRSVVKGLYHEVCELIPTGQSKQCAADTRTRRCPTIPGHIRRQITNFHANPTVYRFSVNHEIGADMRHRLIFEVAARQCPRAKTFSQKRPLAVDFDAHRFVVQPDLAFIRFIHFCNTLRLNDLRFQS